METGGVSQLGTQDKGDVRIKQFFLRYINSKLFLLSTIFLVDLLSFLYKITAFYNNYFNGTIILSFM